MDGRVTSALPDETGKQEACGPVRPPGRGGARLPGGCGSGFREPAPAILKSLRRLEPRPHSPAGRAAQAGSPRVVFSRHPSLCTWHVAGTACWQRPPNPHPEHPGAPGPRKGGGARPPARPRGQAGGGSPPPARPQPVSGLALPRASHFLSPGAVSGRQPGHWLRVLRPLACQAPHATPCNPICHPTRSAQISASASGLWLLAILSDLGLSYPEPILVLPVMCRQPSIWLLASACISETGQTGGALGGQGHCRRNQEAAGVSREGGWEGL